MKIFNILFIIFLLLTFLSGIYVIYTDKIKIVYEPMTQILPSYCPDSLAERDDGKIILFNADSPNDFITFLNMDDYNQYIDSRKKMGIECPVLELQKLPANNYGTKENPAQVSDAATEESIYNGSSYPSFDPYGLQIGVYNNLDKIHDSPTYFGDFNKGMKGSSWEDVETNAATGMNSRFSNTK